jgi:hypothetical protein
MTMHQTLFPTESAFSSSTAAPLSNWTRLARLRIVKWAHTCADYVNTCADYYAAAAMYDGLRRLSDAELHNRGLSRETLARDVCGSCDRAIGR